MRKPSLCAAALLLSVTALAYLNAVSDVFVYDDDLFIVENQAIRSWRNAPSVFRPAFYRESEPLAYRPVVMLSYLADYSVWELDARGFHVSNVALHAINGVLVYLLARWITQSPGRAILAAFLFALHPIQTEAVNGIAFREDLLCLLCMLVLLLLWRRRELRPLAPLVFILAVLSKEVGILVVALIWCAEWALGNAVRHRQRYKVGWLVGWLGVGVVLLMAWVLSPPAWDRMGLIADGILSGLKFLSIVWRYVTMTVMPRGLSLDHGLRQAVSTDLGVAVALLLFVGIAVMAWMARRRRQAGLGFSLSWVAIMAIPLVGGAFSHIPFAERRLYSVMVGACLLAVCLVRWIAVRPEAARRASGVLVAALISFTALSVDRDSEWRTGLSLWRSTVVASPGSYRGRNNLGACYYERGAVGMGLKQFHASLAIFPGNAEALYNVGNDFLLRQGSPEKAIEWYERALKSRPLHAGARLNLGEAYRRAGRLEEAIRQFSTLVGERKVSSAEAHNNLGVCYEEKGLQAEALAEYERALAVDPSFRPAQVNRERLRESHAAKR